MTAHDTRQGRGRIPTPHSGPRPYPTEETTSMSSKPKLLPRNDQEHAHFASRLRNWRAERGLFLKQVADQFGVAEATWSRWEKGERFPSATNLRLLAEFIGVPICCFFYPDDTSCPNCSQHAK